MNNYKVRFFTDIEKECIEQYENVVVPQIDSNVYLGTCSYYVDNITYDYGYASDGSLIQLIDVEITLIEDLAE